MINFQCCVQKQTRYLLSWHFFWQNYSFSAVMYISVRTLPCRKLLNYSVEGSKTRLVKWLPINKALQNQISLDILSHSCHTARIQVWVSVASASPQSRTEQKKPNKSNKKPQKKQQKTIVNTSTGIWQTNASLGWATVTEPGPGRPPQLKVPLFFPATFAQPAPKLTNHPSYYSRFAAATFLHVEHETLMVADTGNTSSFL